MQFAATDEIITFDSLPAFERLWMPMWVFDSESARMLWANRAALDLWNATSREEFLARDFSDMSEATRTRLTTVLRQLEAGRQPVDQWTFYPKGHPVTVRVRRTGIRLADGRLVMFHEAQPVDHPVDPATLRGVEAQHHTSALISLYSVDGYPVMRNPAAVRAYGEPQDGVPLWSLFADTAVPVRARLELDAGRPFGVETRMLTRDGPVWHGVNVRMVTDPVSGEAAILVDEQSVETRREAERRLANEKTLLRTLIDSMSDLIVFKDADGVYLGCNKAFQAVIGKDEAQIIGCRDTDLLPPDIATLVVNNDRAVLDSGEAHVLEEAVTLPDGSGMLLEIIKTPLRSPEGETMGLVAVARDVSERRRAADALKEKEAALRAILDNFPFLIWLKDTEGRFVAVNAAFAEACGRGAPDRVVGATDFDVWPPHLAAAYTADDRKVLFERDRKVTEEPVEIGGAMRWFETYKTAVVDCTGTLLGTAGFTRDVTERVAGAEALRRTSADLARSNAELEQFAYVVSHDLRQPLRSVASFLTLLERHLDGALDEDACEFLDFARSGAQRMDRLIVDLLEYSRIGRKVRPMEPVALGDVTDEAMLNLGAALAESQAQVTVDTPLPTVTADRVELVRLLQNLIGNAIKYRAAGRPATVRVTAAEEAESWRISVADNGIGIAPEHQERIFGIFQRLHGRDEYEGTGIGLAVCRKIAEHHRGRIWVESEPDRGSTFHVTLPHTGAATA